MDELDPMWLIMVAAGGGGASMLLYYTTYLFEIYTDHLGNPYSVI